MEDKEKPTLLKNEGEVVQSPAVPIRETTSLVYRKGRRGSIHTSSFEIKTLLPPWANIAAASLSLACGDRTSQTHCYLKKCDGFLYNFYQSI